MKKIKLYHVEKGNLWIAEEWGIFDRIFFRRFGKLRDATEEEIERCMKK